MGSTTFKFLLQSTSDVRMQSKFYESNTFSIEIEEHFKSVIQTLH